MTFDFEERQGDLFDSITPTDSVVLGVSEDLKLASKGKNETQKKKKKKKMS
jgi:hypothetical protein